MYKMSKCKKPPQSPSTSTAKLEGIVRRSERKRKSVQYFKQNKIKQTAASTVKSIISTNRILPDSTTSESPSKSKSIMQLPKSNASKVSKSKAITSKESSSKASTSKASTSKASTPKPSTSKSNASKASTQKPSPSKATTSKSRLKRKKQDDSDSNNTQSTSSGTSSEEKRRNTTRKIDDDSRAHVKPKPKKSVSFHETEWLKQLLRSNWKDIQNGGSHKRKHPLPGVEFIPNSALKMSKKNGIKYAFYPSNNENIRRGIVLVEPGMQKKPKTAFLNMRFNVLHGKVHLLCNDQSLQYDAGSIINIPTGVRYGLKNNSTGSCFLNFISN